MCAAEKPRPSWSSERPWYVEFFFDKSRPIQLRAGVGAVILLILLYPVFGMQGKKDRLKSTPTDATTAGESALKEFGITETPTAAETDDGTPPAPVPGENIDPSVFLPEATLRPAEAAPLPKIFHFMSGINPLIVGGLVVNGEVWIASSQQVYQVKSGEAGKQELVVKLDAPSFDQVFSDDLPIITSFTSAPDGSLWVGGKDGTLIRYAEYDWKIISSAGEPFSNALRALAAFENRLFVGGQGLWKWDSASSKVTRYPAFANVGIRAFLNRTLPDGRKELLMAADNGVWRLGAKGWGLLLQVGGADKYAKTVADLGQDGFLVGTADGILRVSSAGVVLDKFIQGNEINTLARDFDGHIWAGTRNAGLKYWNGKEWFQASLEQGIPGENVNSLLIDPDGNLWIGIFGRGMFVVPVEQLKEWISQFPDTSKTIDASAPRTYPSVCKAAAAEFQDGNSGAISIFRFDGKEYVFFSGRQICPLGAGFLTSDRTAYLLSGWNMTIATAGNRQEIDIPKDLPADQVKRVLFVDSKRRVWFGPVSNGPFVYLPPSDTHPNGTFENFGNVPQMNGNPTSFILEDKNSHFWVGSAPAFDKDNEEFHVPPLHRFDGTTWTHFTPQNGLNSWRLQDAILRRDGSIAIAGESGLSIVKNGVIEPVRASERLRKRLLYSVFEDRLGDLWFGQQLWGPGVTFFDATNFHNINRDHGLFSDRIIAISQDAMNRMWVVASDGSVGIYPRSYFDRKVAESEGVESGTAPGGSNAVPPLEDAPEDPSPQQAAAPEPEPEADED